MNDLPNTPEALIRQAYFVVLQRAPDTSALLLFKKHLKNSKESLRDLYFALLTSDEAKGRLCGDTKVLAAHFKIFLGLDDTDLLWRIEDGAKQLEAWPSVAKSIANAAAGFDDDDDV